MQSSTVSQEWNISMFSMETFCWQQLWITTVFEKQPGSWLEKFFSREILFHVDTLVNKYVSTWIIPTWNYTDSVLQIHMTLK